MVIPLRFDPVSFIGWQVTGLLAVAAFNLPSPYDVTTFLTACGSGLGLGYIAFTRLKIKALKEWERETKDSLVINLRHTEAELQITKDKLYVTETQIGENRGHIQQLERQIKAILADHQNQMTDQQRQISDSKQEVLYLREELQWERHESGKIRRDLERISRTVLEREGFLAPEDPESEPETT